ncbi:Uncharacterized protein Fot_21745 [Forsythia ovata]|uniref:Uncharacterized protein n=1 Tax=Forsythia ovata TaxID=205694 RepID=A0ABD1UVV7_9LAMI
MAIPTTNPVDTPPPDDGDGGKGGDLSVPGVDGDVFLLGDGGEGGYLSVPGVDGDAFLIGEDGEFPHVASDRGEGGDPDGEDCVGTVGNGAELVGGGVEVGGTGVLEGDGGGEDGVSRRCG